MSAIDEVATLSNNKLNNNDATNVNPPRTPQFGGIKSLIQHSNVLGNVILASENKAVEPLPFSNYSLFDESYGNELFNIALNVLCCRSEYKSFFSYLIYRSFSRGCRKYFALMELVF